jgi:hypothetical protein
VVVGDGRGGRWRGAEQDSSGTWKVDGGAMVFDVFAQGGMGLRLWIRKGLKMTN